MYAKENNENRNQTQHYFCKFYWTNKKSFTFIAVFFSREKKIGGLTIRALTPISKTISKLPLHTVHSERLALFTSLEKKKAKHFWEKKTGQDCVFKTQGGVSPSVCSWR